jgi:hypothetical protein
MAWLAHAGAVQEPAFAAAASASFSASERDKLTRIARSERRLQFIFGHWLARGLGAHWTGRRAEDVVIEVAADGRPQLAGCGDLALSLAHSGPWVITLVAAAVEGASIGIDIEADARAISAGWPVRRRQAQPRPDAVTAAWVLREAQAKAGPRRRAPTWQAQWQVDAPDIGQASLHLAAANVEFSPLVYLVKVAGDSYNQRPIDLHWKQADT